MSWRYRVTLVAWAAARADGPTPFAHNETDLRRVRIDVGKGPVEDLWLQMCRRDR